MKVLQVQTKSRTYPVFIGHNMISDLKNVLTTVDVTPSKLMVMTDQTVYSYYEHVLNDVLQKVDIDYNIHIVPSGEASKSFDNYYEALSVALQEGLDRKSMMIAFGGGVVGDLTGFVAATYMRGIPFIQIPTTLLAHDSAVGGKVAINHPLGKNMIGAFHQPHAVFYDIQFLKTLPINELRSGFAEVVKHGMIQDQQFVTWLMDNVSQLDSISNDHLITFIDKGISIKARIVSKDEKELGIRAYLNFGHTLGHAIESAIGYGKISHGDAVAIGMLFALSLSERINKIDLQYKRIRKWLQKLGFPTSIPSHITNEQLLEKMKKDKKAVDRQLRFVLLEDFGKPVIKPMEEHTVLSFLEEWRLEGAF
ncbi:3-dehydroquinate synthase [Bacillus sp. FJAT-47783]|uniref:3-dehydroquinate synthase n=1 Tax=Bacillus sp. FJAT-47783 TaxID=2922712 RepID=UPI001FAC28E7|nr:3-dehydroquinate synthase [Bacillus sp. FJAT-47783]